MSRRFESRELPYTVLEDIFRSIGFHDRLRCEQACEDWRDLIHTEMAFRKVTVRLVHRRNPSVLLYRGMAPDQNPRPWLADQTWSGIQTPDDLRRARHKVFSRCSLSSSQLCGLALSPSGWARRVERGIARSALPATLRTAV